AGDGDDRQRADLGSLHDGRDAFGKIVALDTVKRASGPVGADGSAQRRLVLHQGLQFYAGLGGIEGEEQFGLTNRESVRWRGAKRRSGADHGGRELRADGVKLCFGCRCIDAVDVWTDVAKGAGEEQAAA